MMAWSLHNQPISERPFGLKAEKAYKLVSGSDAA
jgi:hypothetical protein